VRRLDLRGSASGVWCVQMQGGGSSSYWAYSDDSDNAADVRARRREPAEIQTTCPGPVPATKPSRVPGSTAATASSMPKSATRSSSMSGVCARCDGSRAADRPSRPAGRSRRRAERGSRPVQRPRLARLPSSSLACDRNACAMASWAPRAVSPVARRPVRGDALGAYEGDAANSFRAPRGWDR
jgi:hypothetical protein